MCEIGVSRDRCVGVWEYVCRCGGRCVGIDV